MVNRQAEWFAEEELTRAVIGAFYRVYNALGFGFLESVYRLALARVLTRMGHKVALEVKVPVYFEGELLTRQRVDMIIDDKVVIEIKSTERLHPQAPRQLFNYLRSTNLEVGLLLHFGREAKFYRL